MSGNAVNFDVLSIAGRPTPHAWEWYGEGVLKTPDGTDNLGLIDLRHCNDGIVRGRFLLEKSAIDAIAYKGRASLRPGGTRAAWSIEVDVTGHSEREPSLLIECNCGLPIGAGEQTLWRIVYADTSLPAYRCGPWRGDDQKQTRMQYSIIDAFGRSLYVHELRKALPEDDEQASLIAVAYEGRQLDDAEFDALELTLFMLAGNGGRRISSEGYSSNGVLQWREAGRARGSMSLYSKEIFPRSRYIDENPSDWIAPLLERAKKMLLEGFPLRPVLFHLFSSQVNHPEIALLFLGVVREAMLPKLGADDTVLFKDRDEWLRRIAPAVEALRANLTEIDKAIVDSLVNRLEGLNDISVGKRRQKLWDRANIQPTTEERKILKHRDDVSHAGYILDTSYDEEIAIASGSTPLTPYAERLKVLEREAMVYRNLILRTLLRIWAYEGQIIDACDWSKAIDV